MVVPNEIKELISLFADGMIWIYIGAFFLITYLFISLLTWSFIKPLQYLGIPTLLVGLLLIIIRFLSNTAINLIATGDLNIIKVILPHILKPMLISGIGCAVVGIIMISGYILINKIKKKKEAINDNI